MDGLRACNLKQHLQGEIPPLALRKATSGWVRAMCTELPWGRQRGCNGAAWHGGGKQGVEKVCCSPTGSVGVNGEMGVAMGMG